MQHHTAAAIEIMNTRGRILFVVVISIRLKPAGGLVEACGEQAMPDTILNLILTLNIDVHHDCDSGVGSSV